MIRFLSVLLLAVLLASPALARQTGEPRSWSLPNKDVADVPLLSAKPIDRAALLAEDERGFAVTKGGSVLRFAIPTPIAATPAAGGRWRTLADGGELWQLRVRVPNASDLNLKFDRLSLTGGATLHLFSTSERYYQGPYTAADVREHGAFWSPVLPGDELVIELYAPPGAPRPDLALASVFGGYRDLFGREGSPLLKRGSCNIDVACPLGDNYRDEIRSVARYTINGNGLCTGTLMMDAASSFLPWFLTAGHCNITSETVADSLVFYWNYQMPTCGAGSGSNLNDNQAGSAFRARRADVDMSLVELDATPSPAFNVFYSGWDRSNAAVTGSIHIHHPNGDQKSISFNDDALTTGNSCIGTGGVNSHWVIDNYEQGTTEPGSSGSGVWTLAPNPRLIGFLSGGGASCSALNEGDCYGKFSVAWDGTSAATRLSDWLGGGLGSPPSAINGSNPVGFSIAIAPDALQVCRGQSYPIDVTLGASGGFNGTLTLGTSGLPTGITAGFSSNPVTPPASSVLTLDVGGAATLGAATVQVQATSMLTTRSAALALQVADGAPVAAATLLAPANVAAGVDLRPVFQWSAVAGASQYRLEVAANGNFAAPVIDTVVTGTQYTALVDLLPGTSYSWRVTVRNGCGSGPASATASFTTGQSICDTANVAIPDNNATGVSRSLVINDSGVISDLDVAVQITHSWVGDLQLALRHEPSGTLVQLVDRPGVPASSSGCSSNDIDAILDDAAASTAEAACAAGPAIAGRLSPTAPLSAFNGLPLAGTWTLQAADRAGADTGSLVRWCLQPTLTGGGGLIFRDGFEPR